MTTGKIIAVTTWTFVDKVMSLLFNMLSRLAITFLPRSKSGCFNNVALNPRFGVLVRRKRFVDMQIYK